MSLDHLELSKVAVSSYYSLNNFKSYLKSYSRKGALECI